MYFNDFMSDFLLCIDYNGYVMDFDLVLLQRQFSMKGVKHGKSKSGRVDGRSSSPHDEGVPLI